MPRPRVLSASGTYSQRGVRMRSESDCFRAVMDKRNFNVRRIPVYQDPADLLRHLDEVGVRGVAIIHFATNTVSSQAETGAADLSHCSIWSCPTKPACWITGRPPARTAKQGMPRMLKRPAS